MSRARGKHDTGRKPKVTPADQAFSVKPDSGEGKDIGESELLEGHPLPGGISHLRNPETFHTKPDVGQPLPEFRGWLAHGVPPEITGVRDRTTEQTRPPVHHVKTEPEPAPIPVRIVEAGNSRTQRVTATKNFQAPQITAEPVNICGADPDRVHVLVLNEDSSHSCRIGELTDLAVDLANNLIVGGSLLPANMTSYLKLCTQRPLYILSTGTNSPRISVIVETEIAR